MNHHNEEREEIRLLREQVLLLREIRDELHPTPKLAVIRIAHTLINGVNMLGPVTLTVGQSTKATVVGFDQFGAVFAGTIPQATWSIDNPALDSSTPDTSNGDDIVSLAAGVANLTVSLTSAEGLALTDTETVTNTAVVQVLSSIKIDFSTPLAAKKA